MENLLRWISAKRLMERWDLERCELEQMPIKGYLEKYYRTIPAHWTESGFQEEEYEYHMVEVNLYSVGYDDFMSCQFKMSEILDFEEKHPEILNKEKFKRRALKEKFKRDVSKEKRLRPNQEDKLNVQKIAREVWEQFPLDIKYMKMHPEIKKVVGRQYVENTIHGWLSEIAPDEVKRKGIRDKEYNKKQLSICKKLNIDVPKK